MNTAYRWTQPALAALILVCVWSLAPATPPPVTDAVVPLEALAAAAQQALQSRAQALGRPVKISINELDPRLRLAACSRPLDSSITGDGELHEYTSVAVRCAGSVRWTIYVRAAISSEVQVLTARGALPRGAEPSANDFDTARRSVPGTGVDYPADASVLRGLRLRQPLAAGEMLTRAKLETAALIRRGQKVTLLARDGGIEIRVAAVALADGRPAERIQVQNENSHQIVEAVVRNAALVEVGL